MLRCFMCANVVSSHLKKESLYSVVIKAFSCKVSFQYSESFLRGPPKVCDLREEQSLADTSKLYLDARTLHLICVFCLLNRHASISATSGKQQHLAGASRGL